LPIVPDDKNWTWVLERPCPECGFDASTQSPEGVGGLLRANARSWLNVLDEPSDVLRRRASEDRWSPLEYACHVRDVFVIFNERLELMLNADNPAFANWDQDRSAVDDRYNEQEPSVVARDLGVAATTLASAFEDVQGDEWNRQGERSDGSHFTIDTFSRYFIHDPIHHLYDVRIDLSR
jgi:hypothetical protein